MKFKITLLLILVGLMNSNCSSEDENQINVLPVEEDWINNISVEDLTEENLFIEIEGPAVDSKGDLYVVNFERRGTIGKVNTETGSVELFVDLPSGSIGNAIRFGENDNMYVADYNEHNVFNITPKKTITTFLHEPRMNQPNDIALSGNGLVYASDPNWGEKTGNLWMIKDEQAILIEDSMGTTNGIELSSDGAKLFVNESLQRNIWVYDIDPDGKPVNKKLFFKFNDFGMDGMKFNARRNELFVARYGAGEIVSIGSNGKITNHYKLQGSKPTNLVFSSDFKNCFVTMQERKGVEVLKID